MENLKQQDQLNGNGISSDVLGKFDGQNSLQLLNGSSVDRTIDGTEKGKPLTQEELNRTIDYPYSFEEIRKLNINDLGKFDENGNFHLENELDTSSLRVYGNFKGSNFDCEKAIRVGDSIIFSFVPIRGYWEPAKGITYYEYHENGYKGEFTIYGNDGEHFFYVTFKSDGTKESFIGLNSKFGGGEGGTTYFDGDGEVVEVSQFYYTDHNIIKYRNGDVYEGEIDKNMPEGKGKMTYADGRVEEGIWENGKFTYRKIE